jgi:asparagine synthase (glutamine-hydrolysing)
MCGIAGILDLDQRRPIDERTLTTMRDRLRHRGPDDEGLHVEPGIGLAHRRLSILDPAGGHQPVYNENGAVVAVYNGEIYNYRELASELTHLGHTFRSSCDAEVVVHAWEEWGADSVTRLRGMFAYALWDRDRGVAFLARDRFGIKPLFYSRLGDGRLVFASELKALTAHTEVARELDPHAIDEYLAFGYVPQPRTIYQGVRKLPPAHTLTVEAGKRDSPRAYWDLKFDAGAEPSPVDLDEELATLLRDVVSKHLIADVPLGGFLSGGVDSSSVVAMMALASQEPVLTCTIGFDEPSRDESRWAAMVAERYATRHHVETVGPADAAVLDRIVDWFDEPFADSSAIPTFRLCRMARKSMKVALSGDGADELFAGYGRYRFYRNEERVRSLVPDSIRSPLFGFLGRIYPKLDRAPRYLRAKSTFEALGLDSIDGYFHDVAILGDQLRRRLFSERFARQLDGYSAAEVLRRHASAAPADPVSRAQYLDVKTYLEGDILTKVDRASMAHSLEVRVPMLDHELAEWTASIAPSARLRGGRGKSLLREAMAPTLPSEILHRPKMGFEAPLATWIRGPLRQRVRALPSSPAMLDSGVFDRRFLQQMVSANEAGRRDFSTPLWSLLVFEEFLRRH